ncbi:MAG: efflux RND transporter permease subunit, partial [Bryobacterales bacterium]|nr:efflux RND transporter permease subunit [Bryobacterales bacterium]
MSTESAKLGVSGRIAKAFVNSRLTPLFIVSSILVGLFSLVKLPREEEPQIIVPMIDIFVGMPGASAREVEERVTRPMEKLLWEIPGVEYIYSTSSPGMALAIVRFKVGEDEEKAIVRLNQKMFANFDLIPPGATPPLVKPRSIDDVPILALTFHSKRYNDHQLRMVAAQVHDAVKQTPDVSAVQLIGGQRRQIRVLLEPTRLAMYGMTPGEIHRALGASNQRLPLGKYTSGDREFVMEAGAFLQTAAQVRDVVVGVANGRPVYLRDVAETVDGGEEPVQYVQFASPQQGFQPAVTLSVSKRKGTNAIDVAEQALARVKTVRLPSDVEMTITRHYGETAAEKSNELLEHMGIAVVSVSLLIAITLGLRESLIVFAAIPVTLALTLTTFYLYGYTLNRITLFALIFSIGILVDDAIVVVENLVRHQRLPGNAKKSLMALAAEAVDEVGNPTILATLTVIAAILPMAFVSGLMGPYMRPIPVGASAAMLFSLIVAFVVTPYVAVRVLRNDGGHSHEGKEDWATRSYRRFMGALLHQGLARWAFLGAVVVMLLGSMALVYVQFVKVKMLPFDNKSEFQVIIDVPEGTPLETTAEAARRLADVALTVPEVVNVQTYAGTASPFNFNGLVRHYYLRQGANVADIQVNLLGKHDRKRQSHEIAKAMREALLPVASKWNANIKAAEVPPGPPVLQTLVAEVYGPDEEGRTRIAREIMRHMESVKGIVDIDWYVEDDQPKQRITLDREKAAFHGISEAAIAQTLRVASAG